MEKEEEQEEEEEKAQATPSSMLLASGWSNPASRDRRERQAPDLEVLRWPFLSTLMTKEPG